MTEMLSSTLNPSADVFVPGKISILKDDENYLKGEKHSVRLCPMPKSKAIKHYPSDRIREVAKKLVQNYLVEKKNRGEKTITKQEIIRILEQVLMASSCKVNSKIKAIEARLSLLPDVEKLKVVETDNETINFCTAKAFTFDLSVFKYPKPSFLSSLYGLYRHEQAARPLLSLTQPPSSLKDNLWSITTKDLNLWNSCCDELCTCPPMFGYSVPPSLFGNPFNLDYKCSKVIHISGYASSPNGNEGIMFNTRPDCSVDVELPEEWIEDEIKGESKLEFYSEQLKDIVSGVCDLISDETTKEANDSLTEDFETESFKTLWDADPSKFVRSDEILEDDNCHPLLEMDYTEANEGVSAEVKEMIRKCLSPELEEDDTKESDTKEPDTKESATKESEIDEGINTSCCDPPCSIWCHTGPKLERSDSVSSSSSVSANISLLNDTTEFLLNASKGCIPSNAENGLASHFNKRSFKRSFSTNDCDLSFEERYKLNHEVPNFSTSSREDLEFLRSDPINFFKSFRKGDSWKDSDSGIISHWSSREDIDNCSDARRGGSYFDLAPMWSLFNSEDSLWKPLPEVAQDQHSKFMPRRVRDLRRQKSLN